MKTQYRIGIIGFGSMGRNYADILCASKRWELVTICDVNPQTRASAAEKHPSVGVVADPEALFADASLDAVGIFTLADIRPAFIRRAIAAGKHVIAEKPLAADMATEWAMVQEIEASGLLVAQNLFNRNAWYHQEMQEFIAAGEIGELGVISINHQTPGLMPTEGHAPEGPPFHDCGMHYVDVARWYAGSEYAHWHAQGLRMWGYKDAPWWVNVTGTFANDIVFQITQGFIYGQLAEKKTEHCGCECIGTKGIAFFTHNFHTVSMELHGTTRTIIKTGLYGDKKLDVLCESFAQSLDAGHNIGFPTARDSAIASEVSWDMLNAAAANNPPMKGNDADLQEILAHRRFLRGE